MSFRADTQLDKRLKDYLKMIRKYYLSDKLLPPLLVIRVKNESFFIFPIIQCVMYDVIQRILIIFVFYSSSPYFLSSVLSNISSIINIIICAILPAPTPYGPAASITVSGMRANIDLTTCSSLIFCFPNEQSLIYRYIPNFFMQ